MASREGEEKPCSEEDVIGNKGQVETGEIDGGGGGRKERSTHVKDTRKRLESLANPVNHSLLTLERGMG